MSFKKMPMKQIALDIKKRQMPDSVAVLYKRDNLVGAIYEAIIRDCDNEVLDWLIERYKNRKSRYIQGPIYLPKHVYIKTVRLPESVLRVNTGDGQTLKELLEDDEALDKPKRGDDCDMNDEQDPVNRKCYYAQIDNQANFQLARRLCYDHDAELYMPNIDFNYLYNNNYIDEFWMGLIDLGRDGHFYWLNGQRMDLPHWDTRSREPRTGRHCSHVVKKDTWASRLCSEIKSYICQKKPNVQPERGGCPGRSWRYVETGRCYTWYQEASYTQSEAYTFCEQEGGILAPSPPSLEERFKAFIETFGIKVWHDYQNASNPDMPGSVLCEFAPSQNGCRYGFFKHEGLNSCFRIEMKQKVDWQTARWYCTAYGGYLIKIDSQLIQDFVQISIAESIWIGASRTGSRFSGIFKITQRRKRSIKWVKDKTVVNGYTAWCENEPDDAIGEQDCVRLLDERDQFSTNEELACFHKWVMTRCYDMLGFICQHDLEKN